MVQERNRIQLPWKKSNLPSLHPAWRERRESYIADDFIMEMQRG